VTLGLLLERALLNDARPPRRSSPPAIYDAAQHQHRRGLGGDDPARPCARRIPRQCQQTGAAEQKVAFEVMWLADAVTADGYGGLARSDPADDRRCRGDREIRATEMAR
jgi:hypothetical protein